jgi:hypothetical protein
VRQTKAQHAALVGLDHSAAFARVEAVDLALLAKTNCLLSFSLTSISPLWVPAKMYCDEMARASIDLLCLMRCANTGELLAISAAFFALLEFAGSEGPS